MYSVGINDGEISGTDMQPELHNHIYARSN